MFLVLARVPVAHAAVDEVIDTVHAKRALTHLVGALADHELGHLRAGGKPADGSAHARQVGQRQQAGARRCCIAEVFTAGALDEEGVAGERATRGLTLAEGTGLHVQLGRVRAGPADGPFEVLDPLVLGPAYSL